MSNHPIFYLHLTGTSSNRSAALLLKFQRHKSGFHLVELL